MSNLKKIFLFCFCCAALLAHAQPLSYPAGFFDPARDPIAKMENGRMRLLIENDLLLRSVAAKFPHLGSVEKVSQQEIEGRWWLVMESRLETDIEQSVFLGLRLKPAMDASFFADSYWTACIGEGCGGCDFKIQLDGCFCRYDKPGEPGTLGAC